MTPTERVAPRAIEGRTSHEQRAWGRALRDAVPRGSLASLAADADRPDAVAILTAEAGSRVQELIPVRDARMTASPFAFLRGSAAVMAADQGRSPSTGLTVQLCGDAHIANFGAYATPERTLVFDVNDFDETHAGPFEWDVKRLAASIVVASRDRRDPAGETRRAVRTALATYQRSIRDAADMGTLDAWYHEVTVAGIFEQLAATGSGKERATIARERQRVAIEAQRRTNRGSLHKLAVRTPDGWRLRDEPPLLTRYGLEGPVADQVQQLFAEYRASLRPELQVLLGGYRPIDLARRVVGVGSVGTQAFVILLEGSKDDDVLFLQLKQAGTSALAPWVNGPSVVGADPIAHEGERVVVGQRLMQAASDQFLGWANGGPGDGQHYYLRQLRDMKLSTDLDAVSAAAFTAHVALCARVLAFAHARSGSAPAIAGYVGQRRPFARAIEAWAFAYADRVAEDHAAFASAVAAERAAESESDT